MADGGMAAVAVDVGAIADALRVTKRAVELRARKEGWNFEARAARGGQKRFYTRGLLPADVRDALQRAAALAVAATPSPAFQAGVATARRQAISESVDAAVAQREFEAGAVGAAGLTGKPLQRMQAKLDLLQRLKAFASERGLGLTRAMEDFCDAYNSGQLTVPVTTRQHTGAELHPATLRRWKRELKTKGPAALAGNYGNRAGSGKLDCEGPLRDFAIGLLADKPHISAKLMLDALDARFGGKAELPDLRTVQRWLKRYKTEHAEAFLAHTNPDAWKNRFMSAFGSLSEGITRAGQLWQMDSTPADLQLLDGRYTLVGVIDIAWRGFRLFVTKTSTADSVCKLIRRAILEWGVPEAIKMDNGRDYASDRVGTLLTALHVEPKFSQPFSPWEKGNIERGFRTFSHSLLELLPGYSGHNVAEAQEIRAREAFADRLFKKNEVIELRLTAAELQDFADRWARDYYEHEEHDGLGGITPFQRHAQLRDTVRRIDDVRALDLLMGGGEMRTVTKKGVKLDKLTYIAPELASVIGQSVLVRCDEEGDLGRVVVYHDERFLCVAECPEVLGVSRREIAIEAKARQTKAIQSAKAELRAAKRKANTSDIAWEILQRKGEQNAALTSMPAPNVLHMTPALEAAAEAAAALDNERAQATPVEPVTITHLADLRDAMRSEQAQDDSAEDRFRRALRTLMQPEAERDELSLRFLKNYLQSPEFRGRWSVFEDFGPSSFGLSDDFAALLPDGAAFDRLARAQQGEF